MTVYKYANDYFFITDVSDDDIIVVVTMKITMAAAMVQTTRALMNIMAMMITKY